MDAYNCVGKLTWITYEIGYKQQNKLIFRDRSSQIEQTDQPVQPLRVRWLRLHDARASRTLDNSDRSAERACEGMGWSGPRGAAYTVKKSSSLESSAATGPWRMRIREQSIPQTLKQGASTACAQMRLTARTKLQLILHWRRHGVLHQMCWKAKQANWQPRQQAMKGPRCKP